MPSPLRWGTAALGLLAGLPLGLLLGFVALGLRWWPGVPLAAWVFGTALGLAAVCLAAPGLALRAMPAAVSALLGALPDRSGWKNEAGLPPPDTPPGLRWAYRLGTAAALVLAALVGWMAVGR